MQDCLNPEDNDPEALARLELRTTALADLQDSGARAIRACRVARLAGSTTHLGDLVRTIVEGLVAELPSGQTLPLDGALGGQTMGALPRGPSARAADKNGAENG